MRGEHMPPKAGVRCFLGSSPHARGAPRQALDSIPGTGIIPACAGSTEGLSKHMQSHEDHPRMRGEHTSRPARLVNILA